jgi:hypothetical protein
MAADEVVIVAGLFAYPRQYLELSAYACQPGRSFRAGITYMGFYAQGMIKPEIARIRHREDEVRFTRAETAARRAGLETDQLVARVIAASLRTGAWQEGTRGQVFLLSGADERETIHLAHPILNDTVSARSGKTIAWTQAQRYLHLAALLAPGVKVTSDLAAT